jgi:hypothetical protein
MRRYNTLHMIAGATIGSPRTAGMRLACRKEVRNHDHAGSSVPGSGYRKTILLFRGHVNIVKNSAGNLANSAVLTVVGMPDLSAAATA